jgi:hypothetical protein
VLLMKCLASYYPSLGSCVVLEPLEVFGSFGESFWESLF